MNDTSRLLHRKEGKLETTNPCHRKLRRRNRVARVGRNHATSCRFVSCQKESCRFASCRKEPRRVVSEGITHVVSLRSCQKESRRVVSEGITPCRVASLCVRRNRAASCRKESRHVVSLLVASLRVSHVGRNRVASLRVSHIGRNRVASCLPYWEESYCFSPHRIVSGS